MHAHPRSTSVGLAFVSLTLGCSQPPEEDASVGSGITLTATEGTDDSNDEDAAGSSDGSDADGPDDGVDEGSGGVVDPVAACEVPADGLDAPGACVDEPPTLATAFEPAIKWQFRIDDCRGYEDGGSHLVVANLTDDNGDDAIDQCDTPDVAFTCRRHDATTGVSLFVIDGATGEVLLERTHDDDPGNEQSYLYHYYPSLAAADVNADGVAELVWSFNTQTQQGQTAELSASVEAITGDGTELWATKIADDYAHYGTGITIADLDGSSVPTILVGRSALGSDGALLWQLPNLDNYGHYGRSPVAVDLEADGFTEIVWGYQVFDFGGEPRFEIPRPTADAGDQWAWDLAVADLDEDGHAELLMDVGDAYDDNHNGYSHSLHVFGADGESMASAHLDEDGWYGYGPGQGWDDDGGIAVADVDGDGDVEAIVATGLLGFSIVDFNAQGELAVELTVRHPAFEAYANDDVWYSGQGSITAFDFLGTGRAQIVRVGAGGVAVYAATGELLFDDQTDQPYLNGYWWGGDAVVVADLDNDGSAEFVTKHNRHPDDPEQPHTITAYADPDGGWAGARRIWNQTSYHVSHVREDGGMPTAAAPPWQGHNTFRVQSPLAPGECGTPVPPTNPEG